ncbi:gamma-interferon-responsive lysosomal thiol protein-like isoform X2 [Zingiber officinale]|uniref:gamma-interferon-responsive lysosomal thiol protein-like isoform X2 n=1 Tax=Zingiber officinale TaxID=94328 RepID=UPI001C4D0316|nr:gamma-interferon-responsive lysosomal thiol protein-like isoform X2 [Zingiber officinale]
MPIPISPSAPAPFMASSRLLLLSFFVLSVSYRTTSAAVASSDSASKVSVALYYETLCPYSANFIVNYLAKLFENGLISIVDLELVPYGNARIRNGTISCQHGPYECLLNTVEACAIATWPDLNEHFSFIYCVEDLALKHKYLEWGSCFSKTGLDSLAVLECYDNDYGKKEYEDVEAYICQAYTGKTPNACTETSLITNRQNARTQVHVSFVDNISSRALNNERMIRTAA